MNQPVLDPIRKVLAFFAFFGGITLGMPLGACLALLTTEPMWKGVCLGIGIAVMVFPSLYLFGKVMPPTERPSEQTEDQQPR